MTPHDHGHARVIGLAATAALDKAGYRTMQLDASELAKAEGGLTCCSLLLR